LTAYVPVKILILRAKITSIATRKTVSVTAMKLTNKEITYKVISTSYIHIAMGLKGEKYTRSTCRDYTLSKGSFLELFT
jgi:hypothetical protein